MIFFAVLNLVYAALFSARFVATGDGGAFLMALLTPWFAVRALR